MGFAVVEAKYREEALTKLKILSFPPPSKLLSVLISSPPQMAEAVTWFEFLARRLGGKGRVPSSFLEQQLTYCRFLNTTTSTAF